MGPGSFTNWPSRCKDCRLARKCGLPVAAAAGAGAGAAAAGAGAAGAGAGAAAAGEPRPPQQQQQPPQPVQPAQLSTGDELGGGGRLELRPGDTVANVASAAVSAGGGVGTAAASSPPPLAAAGPPPPPAAPTLDWRGDSDDTPVMHPGAPVPALPAGWTQHFDDGERKPYYHHEAGALGPAAGATQWNRPPPAGERRPVRKFKRSPRDPGAFLSRVVTLLP